jgi:hypothetical protein
MYETYPKGSKHPSSAVGEQDGKDSWNGKRRTSYGNTTVKDTVYNGDIAKTKMCEGGGASTDMSVTCRYPKSREKFDSEKHVGK